MPSEKAAHSELGYKALLLDRQDALTAAVFKNDRRDVATTDDDVVYYLLPAVKSTGGEIELSGELSAQWSGRIGVAHATRTGLATRPYSRNQFTSYVK